MGRESNRMSVTTTIQLVKKQRFFFFPFLLLFPGGTSKLD
jgi:hypothetical protein